MICWRNRLRFSAPCYAACLATLLIAVAGCGKKGPAPRPATNLPGTTPVQQVAASNDTERREIDEALARAAVEVAPSAGSSEEMSHEGSTSDDQGEALPTADQERIALLTPDGPVLVDVWLTLDGRPHQEAFDAEIQQVLKAADTDNDDRPTWEELAANEKFVASQRPNRPSVGAAELKMWIDTFDTNRDGQLQAAEAAAWLGRDFGTAARAFAVRSSRAYLSVASAGSRVWQLLDEDRSGSLSSDEIDHAPEELWAFDANDDRVLSVRELATLRQQLDAQSNRTSVRPQTARYAAIHFEPDMTADRLEYLLGDLYAPRQTLGPGSFGELAAIYEPLDANGDGWLEQLELADMVTMRPHLELSVEFNRQSTADQAAVSIKVHDHEPELTVIAQPTPDRVVVAIGSTRLIISAHDLVADAGSARPGQYTSLPQLRLMVHDECDSLFEELDENADGKLGEREVATSAERLLQRDSNGNAEIAASELPYSMIVAFLRGEQQSQQSFYIPASRTLPNADDHAPAWFTSADFNGDGHISRREFLGPLDKFSLLDANADGFIASDEAAAFSMH